MAGGSRPPQIDHVTGTPAPSALETTGDISAVLAAKGASPLPFSSSSQTQSPTPIRIPTPAHGLPFNPPPALPDDAEDLPTIYRPLHPLAPPPSADPPPQVPTLARYAQICAEIRLDPMRAVTVRARYGLTDDGLWIAANKYWQGQMSSDPALKQRWIELIAQIQVSLTKTK
jgi:hypothetical protein